MNCQLNMVAEVRTGVAFREAIRHVEDGPIMIVQAGDVPADGAIDVTKLLRVAEVATQGRLPVVGAGEVLLQCRGQNYRAAVVPAHEGPMVPTASVLVLTPRPDVRPAYLAHFLNDATTQAGLRALATGATIANLKRDAVGQLEVLVPSLEDQDKIVALGEALRHQTRLEARLAELRRIELRALLEERAERNRGRANASDS